MAAASPGTVCACVSTPLLCGSSSGQGLCLICPHIPGQGFSKCVWKGGEKEVKKGGKGREGGVNEEH